MGQFQQASDFHYQSLQIKRNLGDRTEQANAWFDLETALSNMDRNSDAIAAYHNARELFQAMELNTEVRNCDNAIARLASKME